MYASFLKNRKTPTTLETLLSNMLFADTAPENVIVRERLPLLANLCSAAERSRIEVPENFEGNFAREDGEGIDTDEMR